MPSDRTPPRVVALAMALLVASSACVPETTVTPPPSRSSTPSVSTPTYPASGDAPCGQTAAPDAAHAPYAGAIRRITATDPRTVVFEMCDPDVALPSKLAFTAFAIQDAAWLTANIRPESEGAQDISTRINGTGPYRLDAWNHGSEIRLGRNTAYWGRAAGTDQLVMRWNVDGSQRLVELQAGTVDGIDAVDGTLAPVVQGDAGLRLVPRDATNILYLGLNDRYAPFTDQRVRRAIAMGIDRERLLRDAAADDATVASHVTPCTIPWGCVGEPWHPFDLEAARSLLSDAGFPDGFATKIQLRDMSRTYLADPMAMALALQVQLRDNLSIAAEIEVIPADEYLEFVDSGAADGIHLLGRGAPYADVTAVLDPLFGAAATAEFGDVHTDVAAALEVGRATVDPALREAAYVKANDAIRRRVPMVPVAWTGSAIAFKADVEDGLASPWDHERFAEAAAAGRDTFVWMGSGEPEGLYCADETADDATRVCSQAFEGLFAFEPGGSTAVPALAETCTPDADASVWTCRLRPGVTFHDGSTLDAEDVVLSFAVQWDAEHPLHRGRTGTFERFVRVFGGFLNAPA